VTRIWRVTFVLVLVGGSAACASLYARPAPIRPTLDAPEPPPRTVALPPDEPATAAPTPVIVAASPPPARSPRAASQKPPPEKDVPPPAVPVALPEVPRPPVDATPGGVALQTTTRVDETERIVRDLLTKAARDLDLVEVRTLSPGAKTQYDSARRFVEQGEEALTARNLVFAEQLATKALALAEGLRRR
jgi:hypothetical protein